MQFSLKDLDLYGNAITYYSEVVGLNKIEYYCTPRQPGDLITEKTWKIMKLITVVATGDLAQGKSVLWAGGSPDFDFLATDLVTVKAYTFS